MTKASIQKSIRAHKAKLAQFQRMHSTENIFHHKTEIKRLQALLAQTR